MVQKIPWSLLQTKIFRLEARTDERYLQVTRAVFPVTRVCFQRRPDSKPVTPLFMAPGFKLQRLQSASR